MMITQLKQSIGEITEHLRVITDLRNRAYESRGAYGDLDEIGLDTTLIYKSALILEEQLTYQLNVANQTYRLMVQVDGLDEQLPVGWVKLAEDLYQDIDGRMHTVNPL